MVQSINKPRNETVDIIRGIAILLVVLGHTMTGCTENSQQSFLFNVVWTLQMPLFMLISGYVNKYSKPMTEIKALGNFFFKRTVAYLLPFAVWTFFVRGLIFKQTDYLNIKNLIFNMDSGYWFLFSLWNIAMIFGIASFLGEILFKNKGDYSKLVATTLFYICGMALMAVIGYFMGLSFLCIKLTLYYMPFYFAGYLYGKIEPRLNEAKIFGGFKDFIIAASVIIWIFLLNRYNFYEIGDGIFGIILRAGTSLLGCIAVCGLVGRLFNSKISAEKIGGGTALLDLAGKYSLEIYLIHYLILSMLKAEKVPIFDTPAGMALTIANYVLTLAVVFVILKLIKKNKTLNMLLFGKK